jgi:hypothetical protein
MAGMTPTLDVERDLVFVEEMATDLEPYLLSKTLYWSLNVRRSARHNLLKGTLGGMLIRAHKLSTLKESLTPDQRQRLHDARSQIEQELTHWAVQTGQKAAREVKARLNSWGAYLQECQGNARQYESEYPQQAEGRTILEFLFTYTDDARPAGPAGRAAEIDEPGARVCLGRGVDPGVPTGALLVVVRMARLKPIHKFAPMFHRRSFRTGTNGRGFGNIRIDL